MSPPKLKIPKEELMKLYIDDQMLIKDIASIYNCCDSTISKYLDEYKIPKRTTHPWTVKQNKITKKKYNKYDLSGEYGVGWTSNTNREFYFDIEDYEKIKDICWIESNEGYIIGRIPDTNKTARLHNLVTGFKYVDHIRHNLFDNRKSELREANDFYNSKNRSLPSNNKSGRTGVCWHTKSSKWRAYITYNKEHIELGEFDNYEDAVKARSDAEEQLFGEWSYNNSMKSGGSI